MAAGNSAVTLVTDPHDMRPLLARAARVVVPLRAGSGTRLKILQALAAARPVVSTPLGAEGLDLLPGRHLAIAPLVEPFAAEVVCLLRDPAARAALAAAGPAAVAGYDWAEQLARLQKVYPENR
jgi:polysaccharide biosynthesis protein PslH